MLRELEHLLDRNDEDAIRFLDEKSDELTDSLVAALNDAFRLLHEELSTTVH